VGGWIEYDNNSLINQYSAAEQLILERNLSSCNQFYKTINILSVIFVHGSSKEHKALEKT
jgi:hypothetical protein